MSPNILADLLADKPYSGCVVTRTDDALRLDFDGLILVYRADGWHHDGRHIECLLSDYSAPEMVSEEIRRVLLFVFSLGVGQALSEAENVRGEDPVEYLTDLCARKMLAILDVAALANGRQAKIASNVAQAAARDMRIAELERDLAAKDASLKTANAGLKRICEVIGAPVPCVAEDAVEAVTTLLCTNEGHNLRADRAEETVAEIARALADAGAPQAYHLEDGTERGIPDPERIRLLGERVRTLRAQVREVTDATNYLNAIVEGHNALDGLGAPRLADGHVLSLAARVRSLPR